MITFQNVLILFCFSSLISTCSSECNEKENNSEGCKSIAALKGLIHMVGSISTSLTNIVSSAKYRADAVEGDICISPKIDRRSSVLNLENQIDSDHCVYAEKDCKALLDLGFVESGPYRIWPAFLNHSITVYCDMETDGGGWLVIQRRGEFDEEHLDFYRSWSAYKNGFGDVQKEFWLGNDAIFALTNSAKSTLRIDLEDFSGGKRFAIYRDFLVRSEIESYNMTIGTYEGTAGDSLRVHSGKNFSTKDRGNGCPLTFKGGWWYDKCHEANLNGLYLKGNHSSYADGVNWLHFKGHQYSLAKSEMKIKRCNC